MEPFSILIKDCLEHPETTSFYLLRHVVNIWAIIFVKSAKNKACSWDKGLLGIITCKASSPTCFSEQEIGQSLSCHTLLAASYSHVP